jgi:hypothetical protein
MPGGKTRRFEPWPFLLAGLLVGMMGISVGFYVIASQHPDPVVSSAPRPGVEE